MRTIFYYQTFQPTLDVTPWCTHLHVAAIHFGVEQDGQPYIHLNDKNPSAFPTLWAQVAAVQKAHVKVALMVGGVGGGFASLFAHYDACYPMLVDTLQTYKLDGVDLDVEELATLENMLQLICDLRRDLPNLSISMSPVSSALVDDIPGLGGFKYSDLVTELGKRGLAIDYFCAQAYGGGFTAANYAAMVANGYGPENLVMGQLGPTEGTAPVAQTLHAKYGRDFGGVCVWEYFNTVPTPQAWAEAVNQSLSFWVPL